jgi:hypothetical protein
MSTCESVCIGTDDPGELPAWHRESTPVARKEYSCYEGCGTKIKPGVRYYKVVGLWEGDILTIRQCLPCAEIQDVFSCGNGWQYGGLWEDWNNADGFANLTVYDKCFQKLSDETRRFLVAKWWEWKERQ